MVPLHPFAQISHNQIPRANTWLNNGSTTTRRWLAVQSRAPDANSAFCYGVTTTQIYCRPTCPGRVARRANVVFFDSSVLAQTAGYRACRRCKPDSEDWSRESHGLELVRRGQEIIARTVRHGQQQPQQQPPPWTVTKVAQQLHISAAHFHRLFKKHLGVTPALFAQSLANSPVSVTGDIRPDLQNVEPQEKQFGAGKNSPLLMEWLEGPQSGNIDHSHAVGEQPTQVFSSPEMSDLPSAPLVPDIDVHFEDWLLFLEDVP